MNIAFLYIAEAYQCYHSAAIALDLAARPGVHVTTYYNEPDAPHHLERVRLAYGAPSMDYRRLKRSWATRLMQSIRRLGLFKEMVLRDNLAELDGYDAIFAVEMTVSPIRKMGARHAKLIYYPHGAGDRAVTYHRRVSGFDFALLPGPKYAERMLAQGLIHPNGFALPGYVKLETSDRLRAAQGPLFDNGRPIVLYSAHKVPGLQSWSAHIEPMLAAFSETDEYNLIVAPHVKLFHRRSRKIRNAWEARSTPNVRIDTGSDLSVDMSYTTAADIFIGDVSSQVYEFLIRPRPCIFLNPHRVKWRGNPDFLHWTLGDVIEDPSELMRAIRNAHARHHLYVKKQEELVSASIGDCTPGASKRAADAVLAFMSR